MHHILQSKFIHWFSNPS